MDKHQKDIDNFIVKLRKYLQEYKKITSNGINHPKIDNKDITELNEVFSQLIDLKFERDCDGDSCINFKIVDRTKYEPDLLSLYTYSHNITDKTSEEYIRNMRLRAIDANIILSRLCSDLDMALFFIQDKKGDKNEQQTNDNTTNGD